MAKFKSIKGDGKSTPIVNGKTYHLKMERLLTKEFSEAFAELLKTPMTPKAAVRMRKANEKVYYAAKHYIDARKIIFEEYSLRDDKGDIVYVDDAKSEYKVNPDKADECYAKLTELVTGRTIEIPTISPEDFPVGTTLTPQFLGQVDGIVTE